MALVLVVEDETDVAEVLSYGLKSAGYDTLTAGTGREAIAMSEAKHPDLILLDLLLPDISALQLSRTLKSGSTTKGIPIVIVSAKCEEIDRVVGFEVGADDYVVKPFSMRELLLRIRRSLERHRAERNRGDVLRNGSIRIDVPSRRVWVGETEVELRVTEFNLLLCFCENPSHVMTRERLRELVWGIGSNVALRTVDAHVKRLRDRLGTAGNQLETVRGVGYRITDERASRRSEQPRIPIAAVDDIG